MSDIEHLAANDIAPLQGNLCVVAVTTSSVSTDISGITSVPEFITNGMFVSMESDVECWFFFTATASQTVDETATGSGATVGYRLAADSSKRFRFPRREAGQPVHLVVKGQAAGHVRLVVSSAEH